ncbi:MAG: hypothetical protein NZ521_09920 [Flammeovirgaceae bacterium]|nr:hypothetical protein [Flammeovirgaceae bacterium]MDW8288546.1 hypothetical protein [Flammeovirgaceae bacterium]
MLKNGLIFLFFLQFLSACRDESIGKLLIESQLKTWFVLDSGTTGNIQKTSDSVFYTIDSILARNRQTHANVKKIVATRIGIRLLRPTTIAEGATPFDSLSRIQLFAKNGDSLIRVAQLDTVLRANLSGQDLFLTPSNLSFHPLLLPSQDLFFVLKARIKGKTKKSQHYSVTISYEISG